MFVIGLKLNFDINFNSIDQQLIQTIERIKAEQKNKREETMTIVNPSIFKELTALDTNKKKSKEENGDGDEDEEEDGHRKASDSYKLSTSREALKSGKVRSSIAAAQSVGAAIAKAGMPNKNDSGFSEPTTANSTPTGKQANLEAIKQQKANNKMPDVDSVV